MNRNIVHIEIPSGDLVQSGKFYEGLFGWKITSMPEMNYALWEAGAAPGGGFNPLSEEIAVGQVLIYVASENIEDDLKRAASLGGVAVREKTEIPGFGWFGLFKDPTGNLIGLFAEGQPPAAP